MVYSPFSAVIYLNPLEIHSNIFDSPPSEESPVTLIPPRKSDRQAHALAKQRIKAIFDKIVPLVAALIHLYLIHLDNTAPTP